MGVACPSVSHLTPIPGLPAHVAVASAVACEIVLNRSSLNRAGELFAVILPESMGLAL